MLFEMLGDRQAPAVLFFHAMGVTGASSEPAARYLQDFAALLRSVMERNVLPELPMLRA